MNALRTKIALSEPLMALSLVALAIACAAFLFAQPRRVPPHELPSLDLPASLVRTAIADDERAAKAAPDSTESRALWVLMLEQGAAEDRGFERPEAANQRRQAFRAAYAKLIATLGEARVLRLRAKAVHALLAALDLRLPVAERTKVIGTFTNALARDGVTLDGYRVAPEFVVRTLYKARWNVLVGLSPDHGFARIERRAYHGYQALHAERIPWMRRVEALHAYRLAGGKEALEALGVLLFRAGQHADAARVLEAAYRKNESLRLRNNALAARELVEAEEQ